jgi:hypothetical protein
VTHFNNPSIFRRIRIAVAAPLSLAASVIVLGQNVIMSLPQEPLNAPVVRQAEEARQGPVESRPAASGRLFQYGPIALRTNVVYRYMNAEGLPAGSRRVASEVQTVTPTFAFDFGQHWSVSYTPSWTSYTARALEDTFDQAAAIRGGLIGRYWLLGFSQDFSASSPTLYETGRQTEQKGWNTEISAARSIGNRSSLDLKLHMRELQSEIGNDSRDWSTEDWFMLHLSSATSIGVGPTFGYVEIFGAPDMTYQRYMGRLTFDPTNKLSFSANGGVELRQTNSSAGKDLENPIVNLMATYRPFETTSITLSFDHTVNTSLFDSQVTVGADWRLHFEQRLLRHFYFSADWSRADKEYLTTTRFVSAPPPQNPDDPSLPPILISQPGRTDKIKEFSCRLSTQLFNRLSLAATYQQTDNHSSQGGFGVSSKQYGFEINLTF